MTSETNGRGTISYERPLPGWESCHPQDGASKLLQREINQVSAAFRLIGMNLDL